MESHSDGQIKRTGAQLAAITGYSPSWSTVVLSKLGIDWRTESEEKIKQALAQHRAQCDAKAEARLATITVGGVEVPLVQVARDLGLRKDTLRKRAQACGSWEAAIAESGEVPGAWSKWRRRSNPRLRRLIVVDGVAKTYAEWTEYVDYSRQGIIKRAKRLGLTVDEVIADLARARWKDEPLPQAAPAELCSPCDGPQCRTMSPPSGRWKHKAGAR